MVIDELTYKVIGCAMKVHQLLGNGICLNQDLQDLRIYRNCSHGVLEGAYVHSSLVISKGFSASGMFFPHDSIAPGQ